MRLVGETKGFKGLICNVYNAKISHEVSYIIILMLRKYPGAKSCPSRPIHVHSNKLQVSPHSTHPNMP
jgi:hypothetical protein